MFVDDVVLLPLVAALGVVARQVRASCASSVGSRRLCAAGRR